MRNFYSQEEQDIELLNYVISKRGYITRLDIANDDFKQRKKETDKIHVNSIGL